MLGVGLANQLLAGAGGAAGVDWGQAKAVLLALLVSPVIGFLGPSGLLLVMSASCATGSGTNNPRATPHRRAASALLIFTCTAVSFAHGDNDGQKGMGSSC